jgi:hypothetical protein
MIPLGLSVFQLKIIAGSLVVLGLVVTFGVIKHQRDIARERVKTLEAVIDGYKFATEEQKTKLANAVAEAGRRKSETQTIVKYIKDTMPGPNATDEELRLWALKAAGSIR